MGRLAQSQSHDSYCRLVTKLILLIINCLDLSDEARHFWLPQNVKLYARELRDAIGAAATATIMDDNAAENDAEDLGDLGAVEGSEDDDAEDGMLEEGNHVDNILEDDEFDDDIDVLDSQYDFVSDDDQDLEETGNLGQEPTHPAHHYGTLPSYSDAGFIDPHPSDAIILPLIHQLLFSLFARHIDADTSGTPDVIVTFAALESSRMDGTFKSPRSCPPIFVKFLYCIRMCMLKQIIMEMTSSQTPTSSINIKSPHLQWVKSTNPSSVLMWVHGAMVSVSRVAFKMTLPSYIVPVSPDRHIVEFNGRPFNYRGVFEMVQAVLATLENLVRELLGMASVNLADLPSPDHLQAINDDVSEARPGYSIFSDASNGFSRYADFLSERFKRAEGYMRTVRGEAGLNSFRWVDLSWRIREITLLILMAFYLTRGAVKQGVRLCSETYTNTNEGARNLCWSLGAGISYTDGARVHLIAHAQCPRLSYITFLYLLLIRPLDTFITIHFDLQSAYSPAQLHHLANTYVFFTMGRLLTTKDLTKILKTWTLEYMGFSCGTSAIRQMWNYMKDHMISGSPRLGLFSNHVARQAGHNYQQAKRSYGRTGDRGTSIDAEIIAFTAVSKEYHILLGISDHALLGIPGKPSPCLYILASDYDASQNIRYPRRRRNTECGVIPRHTERCHLKRVSPLIRQKR